MKMERRRLMFMGLAGALSATLGLAATARAGIVGDTSGLGGPGPEPARPATPQSARSEAPEEGVQLAQYRQGPPPHRGPRHRRGRCWNETRRVRYRDRWGRVRHRTVTERVCR